MGSRPVNREPSHNERGYSGSNKKFVSHGSPASVAASVGSGPMSGAGQLPEVGPDHGPGVRSGMARAEFPTGGPASGAAPKGMKVYREE